MSGATTRKFPATEAGIEQWVACKNAEVENKKAKVENKDAGVENEDEDAAVEEFDLKFHIQTKSSGKTVTEHAELVLNNKRVCEATDKRFMVEGSPTADCTYQQLTLKLADEIQNSRDRLCKKLILHDKFEWKDEFEA